MSCGALVRINEIVSDPQLESRDKNYHLYVTYLS